MILIPWIYQQDCVRSHSAQNTKVKLHSLFVVLAGLTCLQSRFGPIENVNTKTAEIS